MKYVDNVKCVDNVISTLCILVDNLRAENQSLKSQLTEVQKNYQELYKELLSDSPNMIGSISRED